LNVLARRDSLKGSPSKTGRRNIFRRGEGGPRGLSLLRSRKKEVLKNSAMAGQNGTVREEGARYILRKGGGGAALSIMRNEKKKGKGHHHGIPEKGSKTRRDPREKKGNLKKEEGKFYRRKGIAAPSQPGIKVSIGGEKRERKKLPSSFSQNESGSDSPWWKKKLTERPPIIGGGRGKRNSYP